MYPLWNVLQGACVLVLSFSLCADAWCSEAHQAISMVTMSSISSQTASHMKRLMGGKDVVDIAGWAHRVEQKFPETGRLHYLFHPVANQCETLTITEANCQENRCIVRAAQHFYGRLMGKPNVVKLDYPHGLALTDSDALKFLVSLLGDLHQPLRLGFEQDAGGKNISFYYADMTGKRKETTLFDFWESDLVKTIATENPSFWYGGWTHANSLGSRLHVIKHEWDQQPMEEKHLLFEKWALESLQKACALIYVDPETSKPMTPGFEARSGYEYKAFEVIKTQLLVAGARTAFVLDTILKERDIVKLRQGSAVEVPLDDDGRERKGIPLSSQRYFRSFCINVGIVAVVLSVFAYITRFYSPAAIAQLNSQVAVTSKHTEKRS